MRATIQPPESCTGSCCPRPFGTAPRTPFPVCFHQHQCAHHRGAGRTQGDRVHEQAYTYTGDARAYVQLERSA